ncbi:hypothetical protein AAZX31_09G104400 [Glycine max]|uniref:Uncharacterized protein n=1 Tax=Glycine max TaxID=3847 RepID=A0A0R0I6Y9_SOYBN|nr:hypothetical protein JHK87_024702 [Glycine soja]KRH38134.1 hypothetical protein GLYMA_09G113200v4 [Glycine max]
MHTVTYKTKNLNKAFQLMKATKDTDIRYFTVNGVFDQDRNSVKQLAKTYPCAIPCFGLHPRKRKNQRKTKWRRKKQRKKKIRRRGKTRAIKR